MSNETELELQRAVGRIEGHLESLGERFEGFIDEVRSMHSKDVSVSAALSKRISKIEKWQISLIAAGSTIAVGINLLLKLFSFNSK